MGEHTHKRADAQRNREAVIEAAIKVLAERPQASMRDVADASGLGRTTVYRHFATRDDLVRALLDRVVTESRETMLAAEDEGDAERVLRRLARDLVALSDRYRFLDQHREMREERVASPSASESAPYERWFGAAQERGELRRDIPTGFMLAMLRGMSVATADELVADRMDSGRAGELLGDVLVNAFVRR
jgi:AcrR family transcriptional regulator